MSGNTASSLAPVLPGLCCSLLAWVICLGSVSGPVLGRHVPVRACSYTGPAPVPLLHRDFHSLLLFLLRALLLHPIPLVSTMAIIGAQDGTSDPILTRLVAQDKVPWYKKPNLRMMYLWLFLCCMGVEMTSGFDSQLINTLQYVSSFKLCMLHSRCQTIPRPQR